MNKRMFNRISALLLALLLLISALCGCAAKSPEATEDLSAETETVPAETEESGQRIRRGTDARFGLAYVEEYGFNPYSCTCLTNRPIISLVFESLFVVNEQFRPEPVLCDKFGVTEDGLTYLITLRSEATFSDGSPVTANDVVYSLYKAVGSAYYGDRFHFVRSFSVYNEKTVRISLYTPYENLPLLLDVPICKYGTADDVRPIGSGPFSFLKPDRYIRRVEDWWQGSFDVVEGKYIMLQTAEQPIEVRDSFEFGTTNLVLADPNSAASVGYRCDYELWNCSTTVMQYLGFNTYGGLFTNASLRKAVSWLIDRETACAKIYSGFALPAALPCSPASGQYDEQIAERYTYSIESFASWWRKGGAIAGAKADLLVWSADSSRIELANMIADSLAMFGIDVDISAVDFETYKTRLKKGQFDFFLGEVRLSNDFDMTPFFIGDGDLNFGAIADATAYEYAIKSLANSGNTYDLYETVMENGLICPILFKSYAVMVTRGTLSSLQPAVDNAFHQPGGRTLADAGATFEELQHAEPQTETEPTEETSVDETEPIKELP